MKLLTDRSAYTPSDSGGSGGGAGGGGDGTGGGDGNNSGAGTWAADVPLLAPDLRGVYGYHRYLGTGFGGSAGTNDPWETPLENGKKPINIPVACRPNAGLFSFEKVKSYLGRPPDVAQSAAIGWCQNAYAGYEIAMSLDSTYSLSVLGASSGMPGAVTSWLQNYFSYVAAVEAANPNSPLPTFRFCSEMNGYWSGNGDNGYFIGIPGGYDLFKTTWQRVHQIARSEGANILFAWAPVKWSTGGNASILDPTPCYPGDSYVDMIGVNWYAREYENPEFDSSADISLQACLRRVHDIAPTKPIILGETGIYRTSTTARANDFSPYFATLRKYRVSRINYYFVYTYYEAPDDYRFRTTEEINAFNLGVNNWLTGL